MARLVRSCAITHPKPESWKNAKCQNLRRSNYRTRFDLHHGSRLCGLCPALSGSSLLGIFRDSRKSQFQFQTPLLSSCRQVNGFAMRSNNCPQRLLGKERLSRKIKAYSIFRCREKQTLCILDKQFDFACPGNYGAFSMSMADRVVFQMDKATSTDQSALWYFRKCGKDLNMDCYFCLCACRYSQKASESGPESLHNFTDFECHSF